MRMTFVNSRAIAIITLCAVGVFCLIRSVFVVEVSSPAIVTAFGSPVRAPIEQAGVYWKWPWQCVTRVDGRLQPLRVREIPWQSDAGVTQLVDLGIAWRFALDGESTGNVSRTARQLEHIVRDGVGGNRGGTGDLPTTIIEEIRTQALPVGVHVVDVQPIRMSLSDREVRDVVASMIADQQDRASQQLEAADQQARAKSEAARAQVEQINAEADERIARIRSNTIIELRKLYAEAEIDPAMLLVLDEVDHLRERLTAGDQVLVVTPGTLRKLYGEK